MKLAIMPTEEFQRIRSTVPDRNTQLRLIADMCRANTLVSVKKAGSGHLGSSLSSMEIVVWLYYNQMNTATLGVNNPHRDIYFSSKGHDVPGLYAVLFPSGFSPKNKF